MESIVKQEPESNENQKDKKLLDVSKILINTNRFSIFSKHVNNSFSLSPLKKSDFSHSTLSLEKKDNKLLFVNHIQKTDQRNVSALVRNNNYDSSPSCRNLAHNDKILNTGIFF